MIIGLSGYAQSGKDTVAELLCLNYGYKRISFALPMRDAIYTLNPLIEGRSRIADVIEEYGWDVAKANPEVRRLLQVFGTEVGRGMFGENFWVDQAFKRAEEYERVVFSDVRFPNEAQAIIKKGGQVWRVQREGHKPVNLHASETAMDNWRFDDLILNHGSLDDLADEVFMLAKQKEINLA
jgi:dephospho-CoA kinase